MMTKLIEHRMDNLGSLPRPDRELQAPRLPLRLDGLADLHYPFAVRYVSTLFHRHPAYVTWHGSDG
jgi:hypothetical protein